MQSVTHSKKNQARKQTEYAAAFRYLSLMLLLSGNPQSLRQSVVKFLQAASAIICLSCPSDKETFLRLSSDHRQPAANALPRGGLLRMLSPRGAHATRKRALGAHVRPTECPNSTTFNRLLNSIYRCITIILVLYHSLSYVLQSITLASWCLFQWYTAVRFPSLQNL